MVYDYEFKECLLQTKNVSVAYGDKVILRDVDIDIKNVVRPGLTQGQVVALLGPSGIGKTTLFRVLAGLDSPDEGVVLVGGDQKPVQRGMVGVVAQNYPLFAHRTVQGNLNVAGKQAGLKKQALEDKISKLLDTFGIKDQANKYPSQLSGGQRQRVAIAQQFMCSEHFLLMDEPFSGLDLVAQHNVSRFIRNIASQHEENTFVIVTHDVSAALEVADTLWLFGRERDIKGNIIPGARVMHTYDLMERGLAWREDIRNLPEYHQIYQEISEVFPNL